MSKKIIIGLLLIAVTSLSVTLMMEDEIQVFLIGDSTMSVKETKAYPETGWGMPFVHFFDSSVTVENHAKNGRSTRTFLSEDRWSPVVGKLEEGDYVFIQFGHNDEVKAKTDRYTTPKEFESNILKFVKETKNKKAIPVLLTPVSRREFDSTGKVMQTHGVYSEIVRKVAKAEQVHLIDLDEKSQALYQELGSENSKLLFLWLAPGEHPNYPQGKKDNTHFNELGARKIAQIVLSEIKALHLGLSDRIVKSK